MIVPKKDILNALSTVQDPDLKKDLITLGMIQKLNIEEDKISFDVVLTTPACPLKAKIKSDCEESLKKYTSQGIELAINMTSQVTTTRSNHNILPDVKNVIAIASGKGGVGKSTVTSNLAVVLAKNGAKVGIIDADIFGPSIPVMFNAENAKPGIAKREDRNLMVPVEQYGVKLLSIGFLAPPENAVVWRGPMASSALRQFLSDSHWGELDYLLIDLPPGTSDIHLTLVQTIPVTGAVIVTTPQKVALADAQKGMAMFRQKQINVPILGVIENMAYFTPEELPENKYYIFGKGGGKKLANRFEVPFLGEIPLVQGIRESGDEGTPVALTDEMTAKAFDEISQELARQISIVNASKELVKV